MGRRIGDYQLGTLKGEYCVVWREIDDDTGAKSRKRFRLSVQVGRPEAEAIAELNRFIASKEAADALAGGDLTIGEIFERYIQDRRKEGKNVDNQIYSWRALEPKFGALFPGDLTAPVMVDGERRTYAHQFAVECERAGRSRDTIWSYLTYLRTAIKWAHDRGLIEKRPYVWLPQKGAPRDIVMDEGDFEKLLNACSYGHVRLFVLLAAGTAARMSAILDLTWDRVDFERGMIDFRLSGPKGILDKAGRKGRSIVEFGTVLRLALIEARDVARTPWVVEWNGAKVKNIRKALETAFRNAGVQRNGALSHLLRHSTATWLADESIDMRKIQKMLGHKDIRTTETIYAKYRRGYLSGPANVIDLKLKRKA
jgi:integrase